MTLQTATFGAGCFWCLEAAMNQLQGVHQAISGYMGGQTDAPTYESVCSGLTGHAEVVQVTFDPHQISFVELMQVFFALHDPTQLNRQGNDIGTQYRSVIFYHSAEQREQANSMIAELNAAGMFSQPIVTEVSANSTFFAAEAYHQGYVARNPYQGYCQVVVAPKLAKFRQIFSQRLR